MQIPSLVKIYCNTAELTDSLSGAICEMSVCDWDLMSFYSATSQEYHAQDTSALMGHSVPSPKGTEEQVKD